MPLVYFTALWRDASFIESTFLQPHHVQELPLRAGGLSPAWESDSAAVPYTGAAVARGTDGRGSRHALSWEGSEIELQNGHHFREASEHAARFRTPLAGYRLHCEWRKKACTEAPARVREVLEGHVRIAHTWRPNESLGHGEVLLVAALPRVRGESVQVGGRELEFWTVFARSCKGSVDGCWHRADCGHFGIYGATRSDGLVRCRRVGRVLPRVAGTLS